MIEPPAISLWLAPEPAAWDFLSQRMRALASDFGTSFVNPHLTLAGSLRYQESEVLIYSRQIADQACRGQITFNTLEMTSDYFRALFLKAGTSNFLARARKSAESFFSRLTERPFTPHLSLAYGSELSAGKTRSLISDIRLPYSVLFDRLDVVRTQGAPEEWGLIASFPLKEVSS